MRAAAKRENAIFTTKVTARLSRNQKEKTIFTTKVAKITKFKRFLSKKIRILRDLRAFVVRKGFVHGCIPKEKALDNLRKPRKF